MRIKIEREHIKRKGFDFYQDQFGEAVLWHEFDPELSLPTGTYDEGNKHYQPGILMPVLWAIHSEDLEFNDENARRDVPTLRFAVPMRTLRLVHLTSPMDSSMHKRDIVIYRNTYWAIGTYNIQGRLRESMIVGVNGTKMFPTEDMIFDVLPEINTTDRPLGRSNTTYETQSYPNHEKPASA